LIHRAVVPEELHPFEISTQAPPSDCHGVRGRVLAAGRAELARTGLAGASVRAIGERAGVTPALIHD